MITRSTSLFGNNKKFIWFDIETTGFNPFNHNIIELSAVDDEGNIFDTLIKCDKKIPKKITEITNITNEMIQTSGDEIINVLNNFKKYIENGNKIIYLIGHNSIHFDLPFIKASFTKYNIEFPNVIVLDTMRIAQYILKDEWSHSLKHLCEMFSIKNNNAHRALSDVYATKLLYNNLLVLCKGRIEDFNLKKLYEITSI